MTMDGVLEILLELTEDVTDAVVREQDLRSELGPGLEGPSWASLHPIDHPRRYSLALRTHDEISN